MTARSLPITIGDEDLEFRFDQPDVIRAEIDYKIGYTQFFLKQMQSLSLFRMLFYYGLKVRDRHGDLVRRCANKEEAGELVSLYLSEHYPDELVEAVFYAFVVSGWMKDPANYTSTEKTSVPVPSKN